MPRVRQLGEPVTLLPRFAAMLHTALGPPAPPALAEAAAAALGHLVQSGGALTADVVEREARPRARMRSHARAATLTRPLALLSALP
jgi:hypothetical protein